MRQPYKHYNEEDIYALVAEIEVAVESGMATAEDYKQLALLESELEEREWV
jgi:hypothetical protein